MFSIPFQLKLAYYDGSGAYICRVVPDDPEGCTDIVKYNFTSGVNLFSLARTVMALLVSIIGPVFLRSVPLHIRFNHRPSSSTSAPSPVSTSRPSS